MGNNSEWRWEGTWPSAPIFSPQLSVLTDLDIVCYWRNPGKESTWKFWNRQAMGLLLAVQGIVGCPWNACRFWYPWRSCCCCWFGGNIWLLFNSDCRWVSWWLFKVLFIEDMSPIVWKDIKCKSMWLFGDPMPTFVPEDSWNKNWKLDLTWSSFSLFLLKVLLSGK